MTRRAAVATAVLLAAAFLAVGHGAWLVRKVSVSVDVKFREPAVCQVFYSTSEDEGLRFRKSVIKRVAPGGAHVEFVLPADRLERIRFDLGTKPGKVRASPVVVEGEETRVLDWRGFTARHDIGRFAVGAKGAVDVSATGVDPYAACPDRIGVRGRLRVDFGVLSYFVLLSALAGWLLSASAKAPEPSVSGQGRRNPAFDLARLLLMFGVVSGHLLGFQAVAFDPCATPGWHLARNTVDIPGFFLIGGYMAASSFERGAWSGFFGRTIRLVWPTVPFTVILSAVGFLSGRSPWLSFVRFPHWLWFLRAYAAVYLLSAVLYRLGRTDRIRWVLFGLAWIAMAAAETLLPAERRFWLPRFAWEPSMALRCFLPFAFGLFVLRRRPIHENPRAAALCGLLFYAGIAVGTAVPAVVAGLNPYRTLVPGTASGVQFLSDLLLFPTVAVAGTVFLLGLCEDFSRRFPRTVAVLSPLGAASLGIYLLHEWPLLAMYWNGRLLLLPSWTLWPVTVAWTILCALAAIRIGRCRVAALVLFGTTKRKNRK